ncbi:HLA class II histocompatibility antigen, DP alpha 1 chain-like [Cyprinodon tularosa]|uniref:HLA class II histocompatibility antigen, DP alpha 1 chain-like n=1 Tax=Cyprinodon tularosa TaxID=77115 RepID=UPI0018E269FA|nr:HLA class II histocompatibility antigen, DP alpha 1 chain-like [Cyprinodon tularosa]
MKMKLLLFLCSVLWVHAEVLHEDLRITGCSESDGEFMYALDAEEMWYADFKKGEGVLPQPPFIDPIRFPDDIYQHAVNNLDICRSNMNTRRISLKNPPRKLESPSSLMVYSRDDVELEEKNILICHVSGFYPAPVNVSWTKNGQKVTEGTNINNPYPNKDITFTQISRLDFIPQLGDVYSCSVEHQALKEPMTSSFDVDLNVHQPSNGPTVFLAVGLTIGFLGVAVGTFFLVKGNQCI